MVVTGVRLEVSNPLQTLKQKKKRCYRTHDLSSLDSYLHIKNQNDTAIPL